jgi:hypothetical protein
MAIPKPGHFKLIFCYVLVLRLEAKNALPEGRRAATGISIDRSPAERTRQESNLQPSVPKTDALSN